MITTLPSVQYGCKKARRMICETSSTRYRYKRIANRRHRRALNRITRAFVLDPERFYDEGFNAPSLSDWDIC